MSAHLPEQKDGLGIVAGALLASVLLHGLLLRGGPGPHSRATLPPPPAIEIELSPTPAAPPPRKLVIAPPIPKPLVIPRRVAIRHLPPPPIRPKATASVTRPVAPKSLAAPGRTARLPGELRSESPAFSAPGRTGIPAPSLRTTSGIPDLPRAVPAEEPMPRAVRNAEAPEAPRPSGIGGGLPRLGGPRGVIAALDLPRGVLGGEPEGKGSGTGVGKSRPGPGGGPSSTSDGVDGGGVGKPGGGGVVEPALKAIERPLAVPHSDVRDAEPTPKPEPVRPPDPPEPEVGLTRARYLSNPTPAYPDEARRQKLEGVVLLRVVVNEKGRVESAELQRSSGAEVLDQAALRGIRRWTFEPARRGRTPVQSTVNVPVRFKLD